MNNKIDIPPPPVPPKTRLVADMDSKFCPRCGSGMYWSWKRFKLLCMQHCEDAE